MERLRIVLPWPPSVNHYYERTRYGGVRIGERGKIFRQEAVIRVSQQEARKRLSGRLDVVIRLYPPDKRKRDLDNLLKATFDALTWGGVWLDDQQVECLRIQKVAILRPSGQLEVLVREMEG